MLGRISFYTQLLALHIIVFEIIYVIIFLANEENNEKGKMPGHMCICIVYI